MSSRIKIAGARNPLQNCAPNAIAARTSWPERDYEAINQIARSSALGLTDLWEISPVRLETNEPRTHEIIDCLFPGDPLLCCGWSRHRFATRRKSRWYKLDDLEFIVPNPMTSIRGLTRSAKQSAHALSNTGPRQFLVVEFDFEIGRSTAETELLMALRIADCTELELSASLLLHLAEIGPLAVVAYSGEKSLHGWFHCAGQSEESLERFMRGAVLLGADPATWTRSQFVRMPDGQRDTGARQTVFFFNPGAMP